MNFGNFEIVKSIQSHLQLFDPEESHGKCSDLYYITIEHIRRRYIQMS